MSLSVTGLDAVQQCATDDARQCAAVKFASQSVAQDSDSKHIGAEHRVDDGKVLLSLLLSAYGRCPVFFPLIDL